MLKLTSENKIKNIIIGIVMGFVLIFSFTIIWLFNSFKEISLNSISDAHNSFARELDYIYDTVNTFVFDYGNYVFDTESVQNLMMERFYSSKSIHENERKHILETIKRFDFVQDVYILNDFNGYVFSTNDKYSEVHISNLKNYFIKDLFIHRSGIKSDVPILCHSNNKFEDDYYAFVFYAKNEQNYPLPGMLILTVSSNWYKKTLLLDDTIDNMLILDSTGNILVASSDVMADNYTNDDIKKLLSVPSNSYLEDKKTGYTTFSYSYDNDKNKYIRSSKLENLLPKLVRIQNIFYFVLFVLLLVFISMLFILISYTILPFFQMNDTIKAIKSTQQYNNQAVHNDNTDTPVKVSSLKEELGDVLIHSKRINLNLVLYDILVESVAPDATLLFSDINAVDLSEKSGFGLMLIQASHRKDIYLAIQNEYPNHIVSKYSNTYWLCGIFSDYEDYLRCQELIYQNLGVRCFLSTLFKDFSTLIEHKNNLFELNQLSVMLADETNIIEEKLICEKLSNNPVDSKDYTYLKARLKTGNVDAFYKKWEQTVGLLKNRRYDVVQYVYNRCKNIVLSCMKEINGDTEGYKLNSKIEEFDKIEDLYRVFDDFLPIIENYFKEKSAQKTASLTDNIIEYIEQNYLDKNLSAKTISDKFDMNTAYINRLFKNKTGKSIGDYINYYRIDKAKVLLKDSDLTIEELALSLGFSNKKYFYVLFKKITAMTPNEYRINT